LSGVVLKGNGFRAGVYMIIVSVVLGFIHWVWGITDVAKNQQLNSKSRPFWIVVVLIIPPIGGMFYYLMKTKNVLM
jgi:tryptophan-rich sensory protein